ncbi:HNH endonuclease [Brevibacterium casei]|uniref:HNH endonuclease n=1 Tax=Brevibacterium casei TaxID=33889 RepID=UPI000926A135|nr:HNH endonuclease signature motif containing protein [Brevibacterium casei]SIH00949.1 HNH endonuclease [Mycobacteroides abscessus subsp. abscessus]
MSVRPAPGNMAYLTAFLPMPEAVAAYANLSKAAAARVGTGASGGCTQSQTMADLLVERVTGQDSADAIPLEVLVVMNDETLFDDGDEPAWLPGFGPIPAGAARSLIADDPGAVFLRRMYARPTDGQLVAMDSSRREFSGLLRRMITVRDDVCRTPWCEATIKHVDHATPVAAGGATSWDNASGLCAACNYIKELPGWRHRTSATELSVTTPTGHRYTVSTRPIDARSTCPVDARPRSPGAAQEEGQARAPGSPPRTIAILAETAAVPKDERVLIDPSLVAPPPVGPPRLGPSLVGPPQVGPSQVGLTSRSSPRPTRRQPLDSAGSVREDSPCERRLRNDLVARAAP